MKEIQVLSLLGMVMGAMLADLKTGRIPNGLIAAGLGCGFFYQIVHRGAIGSILFAGGAGLPVLIFAVPFYFRMIGAGDVKLLCAAGGFMGPGGCVSCVVWALVFGGILSLALMIGRHSFWRRLDYFAQYVRRYSDQRMWEPYLDGAQEQDRFCFSIPVLLAVLCYTGGIY